jgi:hypothetical protein
MKSSTLPSFWSAYDALDEQTKRKAKNAFRQWEKNPFHPSFHFKCINRKENIWSVRISQGFRALGVFEGDTVTWFWAGSHDNYERFISSF